MKIISVILSIIFCANIAFGACNQPVTYLTEGSKTACTGYLFTPEAEMEVRELKMNNVRLEQLAITQERMVEILNKRANNQSLQIENLRGEVDNLETANTWTKIIYFGLGVLATSLVLQLKDSK